MDWGSDAGGGGAYDGQPKYFHSAGTVSILPRKMYTDLHSDTWCRASYMCMDTHIHTCTNK